METNEEGRLANSKAMPGIWVEDTITQCCFVCLPQKKQGALCPAADIAYRNLLSAEWGEIQLLPLYI